MKHKLDFVTNRVFYNFCYLVLSGIRYKSVSGTFLETNVYITFSLSLFEFILIPSFGTRPFRRSKRAFKVRVNFIVASESFKPETCIL